jgi:hypothetical protein
MHRLSRACLGKMIIRGRVYHFRRTYIYKSVWGDNNSSTKEGDRFLFCFLACLSILSYRMSDPFPLSSPAKNAATLF